MKHLDFSLFTFFALLIFSQPSFAQKLNAKQLPVRENYEWQGELPVYVEQLKQELTYPMAWGNSPIKNFAKWKKAARQKIFECMMAPPRRANSWLSRPENPLLCQRLCPHHSLSSYTRRQGTFPCHQCPP